MKHLLEILDKIDVDKVILKGYEMFFAPYNNLGKIVVLFILFVVMLNAICVTIKKIIKFWYVFIPLSAFIIFLLLKKGIN